MKYKVPFIKPSFPQASDVASDYDEIINSNWFTNFGPYERNFSARLGDFIGGVDICTTSNATLSLLMAIKTKFKFSPTRSEVLVPSFTFAAGPEMLILSDFTPVFIDIEPKSWQPSIAQAKEYIAHNKDAIAGILLCNIFGVGNKNIEDWEELAKDEGLPLIIDSAAGLGSLYKEGEYIGARGDCEIFSLHATKPFAVGEGGLISSRDSAFVAELRQFENFGFNENKQIGVIGINAKLQELNAAIGLRQLDTFESRLTSRRESLKRYKSTLETLGYEFQENDELSTVPFVSVLLPDAIITNQTKQKLIDAGVEVRKYYEPLHTQKVLLESSKIASTLLTTEDIYSRILSLPLHDSMSDTDIDSITSVMVGVYEEYKS